MSSCSEKKRKKTFLSLGSYDPMPNSGILILSKPRGFTSHDAVAKIRKLYATKQVGHTGTLDPMAEGVLCVLIGRAVKASEYATEHDKSYRAGLKLGIVTDTGDTTGNILRSCDSLPTVDEVISAADLFCGEIMQTPPMYSALKIGGEKLCDLARRGITVEREARPITIHGISCTLVDPESGDYILDVSCSKGTYIRTLCEDIGEKLGCGATMSSLIRTESGGFTLSDAHTLDELELMTLEERYRLLRETEELFFDCPIVRLPTFFARLALCGNEIYIKKLGLDLPVGQRVRMYDSSFFSLGEVREYPDGAAVKPIKKFRE